MQNPGKAFTKKKIDGHIACWYYMSAIWKIDGLENKHDVTRDDTCMKNF